MDGPSDDVRGGLSGSCGRCGAITSGRSDQASHRTYPIAGRYVTTQNLPGFLPAIQIDAEVEAAPIPKAPEHANIDLSGLLTEEDIRLYQAASEATPHGKIRPVNPHACRKVYAVLDLLRERFTVEWDPESKGYRKAIRRPR